MIAKFTCATCKQTKLEIWPLWATTDAKNCASCNKIPLIDGVPTLIKSQRPPCEDDIYDIGMKWKCEGNIYKLKKIKAEWELEDDIRYKRKNTDDRG